MIAQAVGSKCSSAAAAITQYELRKVIKEASH